MKRKFLILLWAVIHKLDTFFDQQIEAIDDPAPNFVEPVEVRPLETDTMITEDLYVLYNLEKKKFEVALAGILTSMGLHKDDSRVPHEYNPERGYQYKFAYQTTPTPPTITTTVAQSGWGRQMYTAGQIDAMQGNPMQNYQGQLGYMAIDEQF